MCDISPVLDEIFRILNEDHSFYLSLSATQICADKNRKAIIIQRAWTAYRNRRIFNYIKNKMIEFATDDPVQMLRRVSPVEAHLFEKKLGHRLVFRLAGSFPPTIVYKVFVDCKTCQTDASNREEKGNYFC